MDKIEYKDKTDASESKESKVKKLIKAFENVKEKGDASNTVDDKGDRNAFDVLLENSKSNWGDLKSNTPRQKRLKRIGNQTSLHGKSGSIRDWLKKEQN